MSPNDAIAAAIQRCGPLDERAMAAAQHRQARLTKPAGSLGRLEAIGIQLAGICGTCPPPTPAPAHIAVFAADHGVVASGVTPWPQEVTAQMVANFAAGGAAINVLAAQVGASVTVVDVGVASESAPPPGVIDRRVRAGTADLARGHAMTIAEARRAIAVGIEIATTLVSDGAGCLVTGEMGIGSTTASAAVIAALTGRAAAEVTGRGTGIDDEMLAHKQAIVAGALTRTATIDDPVEVLAQVGGLEIGAIAGFVLGGAAARVPVVIDGVIALAGLLMSDALAPGVASRTIAGHRSVEPGATVALEHLALDPVLDLEMRLGEGTGACLAIPIVQAAARILSEMATFDDVGIES